MLDICSGKLSFRRIWRGLFYLATKYLFKTLFLSVEMYWLSSLFIFLKLTFITPSQSYFSLVNLTDGVKSVFLKIWFCTILWSFNIKWFLEHIRCWLTGKGLILRTLPFIKLSLKVKPTLIWNTFQKVTK